MKNILNKKHVYFSISLLVFIFSGAHIFDIDLYKTIYKCFAGSEDYDCHAGWYMTENILYFAVFHLISCFLPFFMLFVSHKRRVIRVFGTVISSFFLLLFLSGLRGFIEDIYNWYFDGENFYFSFGSLQAMVWVAWPVEPLARAVIAFVRNRRAVSAGRQSGAGSGDGPEGPT